MAVKKYTLNSRGYYATRVWDGTYNADGSKHRTYISSKKSSRDLELKVAAFKRKVEEGTVYSDTKILFGTYARYWLKTYKQIRTPNTMAMYRNILDHHLSALFCYRIGDLNKSLYQSVINSAFDRPRTCQQIALTFRQIIKSAISDRCLPLSALSDICDGVSLPVYKPAERRVLTAAEKEAMLTADLSPRERAFILILYGCGLRRGEALALLKEDVDFEKNLITVSKSLAFEGNDYYIKEPKSVSGTRCVPMPHGLAAYLKTYMETLSSPWLFARRDGGRMTLSGYTKMWSSILRKMNLAAGGSDKNPVICGLTAHIFRHNYCSALCYQIPSISLKRVASLMGDTLPMVTNVYNHLMEEQQDLTKTINRALDLQ